MNTNDTRSLRTTVLKQIKPTEDERVLLSSVADELMKMVNSIALRQSIPDVSAQLVGSAARGTWISGTHDLDIFITFPEKTSREELEEHGLSIAREIARDADRSEERYAEHPYINMRYRDFDVDLVPCFRVQSPDSIKSAVDRTPFHNEFIKQNISGLEDDVLLLKQFMRGGGVYGSELRTQGFSGYLTELMVIHFGSFEKVLDGACDWKPGFVIDIMGHGSLKHKDPLVVVDPTDPKRNVAAALSLDNFSRFIDVSRSFFEKPTNGMFFPLPGLELTDPEFTERLNSRKSAILAVVFKTPDVVDDVLYPQLYKMEQATAALLEDYAFTVMKTGSWAGDDAVVLLELMTSTLPDIKKHIGPPVWVRTHAGMFKSKYEKAGDVFSMYIENGRYVVEIPRKYADAKELLGERLGMCSLGKHISASMSNEFEVLEGEGVLRLKESGFRVFLGEWV
ncbi:MAG TPA: CCA tRNA nucleotidyltransferase [Methanosarcinaceae archaeon]|nr:CCA tRNA nucleotidyltransferase [Methanosarcinaceae archaeon]